MNETSRIYDVVIVGGGPAGLSAAIWCADLDLDAVLVEGKAEFGGNLLNIFNPIENYPGLIVADGRKMRDLMEEHARRSKTALRLAVEAVRIDPRSMTAELANGEFLVARNIVLATGVRRRRMGLPGETEFIGRGILESGSKSPEVVAGKRVAIVGGGDAALENAVILSKHAEQVYVIHRGKHLSARSEFVDAAQNASNVEFLLHRQITAIVGGLSVEAVEIDNADTPLHKRLEVEYVLLRIGTEPCSALVQGLVETDGDGYVITNNRCQTSLPAIFAIGDVANPGCQTIVSAAGHGATAAKLIRSLLVQDTVRNNRILG